MIEKIESETGEVKLEIDHEGIVLILKFLDESTKNPAPEMGQGGWCGTVLKIPARPCSDALQTFVMFFRSIVRTLPFRE